MSLFSQNFTIDERIALFVKDVYFYRRSMQNLRQLKRLDIGNNRFADLVSIFSVVFFFCQNVKILSLHTRFCIVSTKYNNEG